MADGVVILPICLLFSWVSRAKLGKDITIVVVAAAGTILASVVVVSITQYNTKLREVTESHRLKKIEIYGEFEELVFSIFRMISMPDRLDLAKEEKSRLLHEAQAELEEKYSLFSKELLLWGAPDVINGWLVYMAKSRKVDARRGGKSYVSSYSQLALQGRCISSNEGRSKTLRCKRNI